MSPISDLCDQITTHATAFGRKTKAAMLPGLSECEILKQSASLPFLFPQSVIDLYKWSEGLCPQAGMECELFPGFEMCSLSAMSEMYAKLSQEPEFPRFRSGHLNWFPLFQSGSMDFYGVICEKVKIEDAGIVYDYNEGEHRDGVTAPLMPFPGLELMLESIIKNYETGGYYIDSDGDFMIR